MIRPTINGKADQACTYMELQAARMQHQRTLTMPNSDDAEAFAAAMRQLAVISAEAGRREENVAALAKHLGETPAMILLDVDASTVAPTFAGRPLRDCAYIELMTLMAEVMRDDRADLRREPANAAIERRDLLVAVQAEMNRRIVRNGALDKPRRDQRPQDRTRRPGTT